MLEEDLKELEYMLGVNLLDNISMSGHAVIRDFLVHHNNNSIARINYKKIPKTIFYYRIFNMLPRKKVMLRY